MRNRVHKFWLTLSDHRIFLYFYSFFPSQGTHLHLSDFPHFLFVPARIPLLFCLLSVIPLDILLGISTCIFGTANKELLFLLTNFPCFVLFRFLLGVTFPFFIWGGRRVGWVGIVSISKVFFLMAFTCFGVKLSHFYISSVCVLCL